MNKNGYKFDWEKVVHVADDAPQEYRPSGIGVIVGMRTIETQLESKGAGCPIGSVLFQVEFGNDGLTIEMLEQYIRPGAS
jgi:hypothetical protein